jgi:hypothetical protein
MKINRLFMILSFILVLVVNLLGGFAGINGKTTGEISDAYPILFVPAGYVFSIWSLIYILLIAFNIYIITPKGKADPQIDSISVWVILSNLFNAAWILLWHYELFVLSAVAIVGLLVSLIAIYLKLRIGTQKRNFFEILFVSAPFSVYLGWATVAVVANISQVLYFLGWRGAPLTEAIWTVIMLGVASLIGVLMIFFRKEVLYPLVLTWAFVGIWVKHGSTPAVALTALIAAIFIASLSLGRWIADLVKKP